MIILACCLFAAFGALFTWSLRLVIRTRPWPWPLMAAFVALVALLVTMRARGAGRSG